MFAEKANGEAKNQDLSCGLLESVQSLNLSTHPSLSILLFLAPSYNPTLKYLSNNFSLFHLSTDFQFFLGLPFFYGHNYTLPTLPPYFFPDFTLIFNAKRKILKYMCTCMGQLQYWKPKSVPYSLVWNPDPLLNCLQVSLPFTGLFINCISYTGALAYSIWWEWFVEWLQDISVKWLSWLL